MSPLAERYVAQRDALSPAELELLISELRGDLAAASELRELLATDELLHRCLAPERQDMVNRLRAAQHADTTRSSFIKRVVRARRRSRSLPRYWHAAAAALLVVCGGALAVWLAHGSATPRIPATIQTASNPSAATLVAVTGSVQFVGGAPCTSGFPLFGGQSLIVGDAGLATIALADGSRFLLGPGRLDIRTTGPTPWYLANGELQVVAAHQAAGQPLIIKTPHASAQVVGTRFRLVVVATHTHLEVAAGLVAFAAAGTSVHIAAGGSAAAETGRPPLDTSAVPTADLALWLRADTLNGSAVARWQAPWPGLPEALQSNPAQQPTFVATALAGLPGVVFDGVDDVLHLSPVTADLSQGFTAAFVLADLAPSGVTELRLLDLGRGTNSTLRLGLRDTLLQTWDASAHDLAMVGSGPVRREGPHLLLLIARPDGTGEFRWDGVTTQRGKVLMPAPGTCTDNLLGWSQWTADRHFAGALSEIVLVRRPLSGDALIAFEQRLQRAWALSAAAP